MEESGIVELKQGRWCCGTLLPSIRYLSSPFNYRSIKGVCIHWVQAPFRCWWSISCECTYTLVVMKPSWLSLWERQVKCIITLCAYGHVFAWLHWFMGVVCVCGQKSTYSVPYLSKNPAVYYTTWSWNLNASKVVLYIQRVVHTKQLVHVLFRAGPGCCITV